MKYMYMQDITKIPIFFLSIYWRPYFISPFHFFMCELEALQFYGKSKQFFPQNYRLAATVQHDKIIVMLVKRVFVAGCYNASTIKSETSTDLPLFSPPLCQKYCLQKEIYLFAVQVKFYENAAFVEKKNHFLCPLNYYIF